MGNVLSLDRVNLNFKQIRKHEKKFFWLLVELMSRLIIELLSIEMQIQLNYINRCSSEYPKALG